MTVAGHDRWLTHPVECGQAAGFGVYLHVPFCHHRCGYCDFATQAVGDDGVTDGVFDAYAAALVTDLGRQLAAGPRQHAPSGADVPDHWPTVTSVFVGGGTPTLIGGQRLARIVAAVGERMDLAPDAEVTVECNPETASEALFTALVDASVTRVSMGAQSFAPHVLTTLERGHSVERPLEAVREARAGGIGEVSLDLIYGTPGESDEDWQGTLDTVVAAEVDHVSAYALTIHADTPFGRAVQRGTMPAPDEDVQRERFDLAGERLGKAGFDQYEVSNWSRGPARRSRHNLLYWRHGNYLGIGVGAHGHLAGRRWWSTRSTARYLAAVQDGATPITGQETLDEDARAVERLLLGLRVREGLHPHDLPPVAPLALEEAIDAGLVETACGRVRCTAQGWFLLDAAVAQLTS